MCIRDRYSIDLNKALTSLGVPAATINIVDSAVGGNTAKAMDTLKSAYQTEGDTDIDTIISLASMFDMYEQMDKYITVTETENGGYSLKMNIKSEDMPVSYTHLDVYKRQLTYTRT